MISVHLRLHFTQAQGDHVQDSMAQGMFQYMAIPNFFNLLFLSLIDIQMIKF